MAIPKHFRLTSSKGSAWVQSYLLKYSKKLPRKDALRVDDKLLKEIEKVNEEVEKTGLPSNLQLAHVHANVATGVFLKPTSRAIKAGTFIGIYTGLYELVESAITSGTSYAYDVAQELTLKKNELRHVVRHHTKTDEEKDYSIQTNAFEMGNFTRYINHTSLDPNIEAVVSKFPDGRMEIVLFALHSIQPGEQLLSCYGGQYWQVLDFIPDDMNPDTYLLTPSLKVKLSNPLPALSPKQKTLLIPLRNVSIETPIELDKHPLMKALRKKLPSTAQKQRKALTAFEDIVLERGIPRKWQISSSKSGVKVTLKEDEKIIKKNELIGVIAGTFSLKDSSSSFLLAQNKKAKLFLDCKKESNFLSKLTSSPKTSNVSLKMYFDDEEDSPMLLAFASKPIHPKDSLVLGELKALVF
jgi:hypothetical protein